VALLNDEIDQPLLHHPSAHDALDGGEAGVVPAFHHPVLHELGEFTFRKHSVFEVESAEVLHDWDVGESQATQQPMVEVVPVSLLVGTHAVGHILQTVHDRGRKVLDGLGLLLRTKAIVRFIHTSLEHWVSHALVLVLLVDLGPDAVLLVLALQECIENAECLFLGHVPVLRFSADHAFLPHLLLRGVVRVGQVEFDESAHPVLDLVELVAGEGDPVGEDP